MTAPKWRAIALGMLIFGCGVATGVGGSHYVTWKTVGEMADGPPEMAHGRMMLWVLTRKLGLSHDQRDRVRAILDSHHTEMRELHRELAPKMMGVRKQIATEIRDILTDSQKQDFDRLREKWEQRRKERGAM